MRHCLRLDADDDAPNPEKVLLNHNSLFDDHYQRDLGILVNITFNISLATLSEAPGDDFKGQAIVRYTQDFRF